MLGFVCIAEQTIYILFEIVFVRKPVVTFVALPVFDVFVCERYILHVTLAVDLSAVFAKPIDFPRSVKHPSLGERKLLPEFGDCGLQHRESFFKNVNDLEFVAGPIALNRIQASQRS